MKIFTTYYLECLIKAAEQSQRLRAHFNLHQSYQDSVQKLFIALKSDSYIRPHRHALDPKEECLIAIRGLMSLVLFSGQGEVDSITLFGSEKYAQKNPIAYGVQIPANTWHTVIPLSDDAIIFEVKDGPFDANIAKEYAPWSPAEGSVNSIKYFQALKELCIKYMGEGL